MDTLIIADTSDTLIVAGLLGFYFLPALIAIARESEYQWPIALINFFAGWTLIGWLVALVWAVMPKKTA